MEGWSTANRLTIQNNVFFPSPVNVHKAFVCSFYVSKGISFTWLKMDFQETFCQYTVIPKKKQLIKKRTAQTTNLLNQTHSSKNKFHGLFHEKKGKQ